MTTKIPLFRPSFDVDQVLPEIADCLNQGWTGMGFKTDLVERDLFKLGWGDDWIFLNSCTSALFLACEVLKREHRWSSDSVVHVPAITFISTYSSVDEAQLTPKLVDVDKDTLNMSLESLKTEIGPKSKAVIFVTMGGNCEGLDEIASFCTEHGLKLIIDAAHGASALWLQTFRSYDALALSFQAVKPVPSGDSGALRFTDNNHAKLGRKLSWMGIDKSTFERTSPTGYSWEYDVDELGYKLNGNSIMACLVRNSLKNAEQHRLRRQKIHQFYRENLSAVGGVQFINHLSSSAYHLAQILVSGRDRLIEHGARNGISFGVHYKALIRFPYCKGQTECSLSNALGLDSRLISLPLYLDLSPTEILRIVSLIRSFLDDQL